MTPAAGSAGRIHDVLIVGGGLVGASLAIALQPLGLDVGLVEATPTGQMPTVFDERNLSFAEATVNALTALGVMQLLRVPPGSIRRIHVSRSGDFGRIRMDAAAHGREEFGQVVVARDFGEALEARLSQLATLVRYRPARFDGLQGDAADGVRALRVTDAEGPRTLHARLLVAEPATQASVIGVGGTNEVSLTGINWTDGNGASRLVVVKAGSAVDMARVAKPMLAPMSSTAGGPPRVEQAARSTEQTRSCVLMWTGAAA